VVTETEAVVVTEMTGAVWFAAEFIAR